MSWEPGSLGSGVGCFVRLEMRDPDKVRVMPCGEICRRREVTVRLVVGVVVFDALVLLSVNQCSIEIGQLIRTGVV